jgi:hypothetical protein
MKVVNEIPMQVLSAFMCKQVYINILACFLLIISKIHTGMEDEKP